MKLKINAANFLVEDICTSSSVCVCMYILLHFCHTCLAYIYLHGSLFLKGDISPEDNYLCGSVWV
jgi:hypothetical protein